jgi:hypothetical protein
MSESVLLAASSHSDNAQQQLKKTTPATAPAQTSAVHMLRSGGQRLRLAEAAQAQRTPIGNQAAQVIAAFASNQTLDSHI